MRQAIKSNTFRFDWNTTKRHFHTSGDFASQRKVLSLLQYVSLVRDDPADGRGGRLLWSTFPIALEGAGYIDRPTKDNNLTPDSYRDDNKKYQSMKQHFNPILTDNYYINTGIVAGAEVGILAVFFKRYQKVSTDMNSCKASNVRNTNQLHLQTSGDPESSSG